MQELARIEEVTLEGRKVPVAMRKSRRARRVRLRVSHDGVEVVVPWRTPWAAGRQVLVENSGWVVRALGRYDQPLADGTMLYQGRQVKVFLRHAGVHRAELVATPEALFVVLPQRSKADPEAALLRLLKEESRERLEASVQLWAQKMGVSPGDVRIKDTSSRWGSCSRKGNLNFSWRLLLAPPAAMEYVVVHELAHLRHFDHSKGFWLEVERWCPNARRLQNWFKQEGWKVKLPLPEPAALHVATVLDGGLEGGRVGVVEFSANGHAVG